MLFDPSEDGEVASSRERTLTEFTDLTTSDGIQDSDGELQTDRYGIKIVNPVQFNLTVEYLAVGVTFRQVGRIIRATREQPGLASIGSINKATVRQYTCFVCALILQKILDMLITPSVWAFSISLDMSTHQGVLYLDIRIYLCWQGDFLKLHLVSIPVFDRHIGENMFNVSAICFDCIYREWQKILVGIVTDHTCSMTGRIQGLTTRF